jgi:beta-galactosidase
LRRIKKSGLDCVRFGEFSWAWFEPEDGRFDFSAYDAFMDTADACGLKLILCTPTAAPPEWLLRAWGDARMIDSAGRPHDGGRHMACLFHPEYLRLSERAIRALAERYKDHPALAGWQIDNEPTMGESAAISRLYDYNPHAVLAFRRYLREKYRGDLGALNARWQNSFWSRTYTDWAQIDPPARPGIPSLWLEWMRFRSDAVTRFVRRQREILREVKPDFLIGVNIPECGPRAGALLGQDYWEQSAGMAYAGTDIYCYTGDRGKDQKAMAYCCDAIASAARQGGAEFWICETPGGPHFSAWSKGFYDGAWGVDFLEDSVLRYAAHGAKRVLFFLWRPTFGGQEFGMNGLADMDGGENERTQAIGAIFEKAARLPARTAQTVHVHYSADSICMAAGFDPDKAVDDSMHGWHSLFADCGYAVEFVSDSALAAKKWRDSDILALPYSMALGEAAAEAIKAAAAAGARLLAGYGTGLYNGYGCHNAAAPGFGLDKVFGLRVKSTDYAKPGAQARMKETGLAVGRHRVLCAPQGARAVAVTEGGEALVLRNGPHLYFAFDPGELYENTDTDGRPALLDWFANIVSQRENAPMRGMSLRL